MEVKVLTPGDEPALRAFLGRRIEHAMFLLSNLRPAGVCRISQRVVVPSLTSCTPLALAQSSNALISRRPVRPPRLAGVT